MPTILAAGLAAVRRAFARLDADALAQVLGAYLWTKTVTVGQRRVIAIDGKTVRGARTKHPAAGTPRTTSGSTTAPHLVAAFDHTAGTVLGQVPVTAKSNEIPAVHGLLRFFGDLAATVVTVDAMHTQTDTTDLIIAAGGDYVFTVKRNQPGPHTACKQLPWNHVPAHRVTSHGHGRRVTRTIKILQAPHWITFPGAAQLAQVRRTVTRQGKKTVEVVYLITSADYKTAPPRVLAAWVQGHWGIENQLHWVRHVTFDEDRSQVRVGHTPQVMATLRNTAISLLRLTGWTNIAASLQHHARDPDHPIEVILAC